MPVILTNTIYNSLPLSNSYINLSWFWRWDKNFTLPLLPKRENCYLPEYGRWRQHLLPESFASVRGKNIGTRLIAVLKDEFLMIPRQGVRVRFTDAITPQQVRRHQGAFDLTTSTSTIFVIYQPHATARLRHSFLISWFREKVVAAALLSTSFGLNLVVLRTTWKKQGKHHFYYFTCTKCVNEILVAHGALLFCRKRKLAKGSEQ